MLDSQKFNAWVSRAHEAAEALFGNLGISQDVFAAQLSAIAQKYRPENPDPETLWRFLEMLHTDDLFLSIACACHNETAWVRFDAIYHPYLTHLCPRWAQATAGGKAAETAGGAAAGRA